MLCRAIIFSARKLLLLSSTNQKNSPTIAFISKSIVSYRVINSNYYGANYFHRANANNTKRNLGWQTDRMDKSAPGPVQSAATIKLKQMLKPTHMDVINESYMHNVPKGSESHFKLVVVSDQFVGKSLIQRHRMVHDALHEELETGAIHALSVVAKTPEQWSKSQEVSSSPKCMGGSKN